MSKHIEVVFDGKLFRIEEDYPEVGAYLYVYENGICIKDFLQNDVTACKQLALEEYGISISQWV